MLEIKDLIVSTDNKKILNHFNLTIQEGEIHVLMGPNGAGKSTVCKSIMHHPSYKIEEGKILYQTEDITNCSTSEIARKGIYYIQQSPIEIEGITNLEMLRSALIERKENLDTFAFHKQCKEICEKLNIPTSFVSREVNVGMSGGEKKKNELLGMWILSPKFLLLDEIDSGLDVDAIRIVGENLKEYQQKTNASMLVITHQQSLIDQLEPTYVHRMQDGKIIESGTKSLAKKIEKYGFLQDTLANDVSESEQNE